MTREEKVRKAISVLIDCAEAAKGTEFSDYYLMGADALRRQEHFREVTKKVEPLTLDELRKMDGDPVWAQFLNHAVGYWDISNCHNSEFFKFCRSGFLLIDEYGKTWLAYRQKPEEG